MLVCILLLPTLATLGVVQAETEQTHQISDQNLADSHPEFAINLYKALRSSPEATNVFFSPLSVATALAMVLAGAEGNTGIEILHVLNDSGILIDERFSDLLFKLHSYEPSVTLHIVNRLFAEKTFPIRQDYITVLKEYYNSDVQSVDFRKQAERARKLINDWVSKQTHDKIKDLIQEGQVNPSTNLVHVNAIYFKGRWRKPFNTTLTTKKTFFGTKREATVDMMSADVKVHHAYNKDLDVDVVALPYAGDMFAMIIVLPKKKDGIFDLEKKLTAFKFTGLLGSLEKKDADVLLPKFKLSVPVELKEFLKSLGARQVFSEAADLSGITKVKGLSLAGVVHKAFVEVNEEGTEAAAATGAIEVGARPGYPERIFVNVDHPFLFAIQGHGDVSPLFLGSIHNL